MQNTAWLGQLVFKPPATHLDPVRVIPCGGGGGVWTG